LAPKFDADGLVTCVVTDARSGDVLMVAHMNAQALQQTIATGLAGEAHAGPRVAPRAPRRRAGMGITVRAITPHQHDPSSNGITWRF
jgi:hypothetical protein